MKNKKPISRKSGKTLIAVILVLVIMLLVYGIYGVSTNKELFTGAIYDEMDGIFPYIILLSSLPLILAIPIIGFFMKRKE